MSGIGTGAIVVAGVTALVGGMGALSAGKQRKLAEEKERRAAARRMAIEANRQEPFNPYEESVASNDNRWIFGFTKILDESNSQVKSSPGFNLKLGENPLSVRDIDTPLLSIYLSVSSSDNVS